MAVLLSSGGVASCVDCKGLLAKKNVFTFGSLLLVPTNLDSNEELMALELLL